MFGVRVCLVLNVLLLFGAGLHRVSYYVLVWFVLFLCVCSFVFFGTGLLICCFCSVCSRNPSSVHISVKRNYKIPAVLPHIFSSWSHAHQGCMRMSVTHLMHMISRGSCIST